MQIGDEVTWTHTSFRGHTMSMSLRQGTIVSISGDTASVKTKRGRAVSVSLCRLRRPNEKTEISAVVELLVESARVDAATA